MVAISSNKLWDCFNCKLVVNNSVVKFLKDCCPITPTEANCLYILFKSKFALDKDKLKSFKFKVPILGLKAFFNAFSTTPAVPFTWFNWLIASDKFISGFIFIIFSAVNLFISIKDVFNAFKLVLSKLNLIPYSIVPPFAIYILVPPYYFSSK